MEAKTIMSKQDETRNGHGAAELKGPRGPQGTECQNARERKCGRKINDKWQQERARERERADVGQLLDSQTTWATSRRRHAKIPMNDHQPEKGPT